MLLTLGSFMVRVRVALGREVEVDLEREVSPSVDR
jgi:hypothetical protein